MKRILWGLALVFVTSAFAQQQPPTNSPPYTTPPTFPDGRPQQQMPPDTKAPPPQDLSDSEVEQQIQKKLGREPALARHGDRSQDRCHISDVDWVGGYGKATRPRPPYRTIVCRPSKDRGQDQDSRTGLGPELVKTYVVNHTALGPKWYACCILVNRCG